MAAEREDLTAKLATASIPDMARMLREEVGNKNRDYIVERIMQRIHKRVRENIAINPKELLSRLTATEWLGHLYASAIAPTAGKRKGK